MILCSGAFDGLHVGHVRYLQAAAQLKERETEPVVVSVAPDDYIRSKGREPHWSAVDRLRVLHAIAHVDAAFMARGLSVALDIRELRPRLFVKGADWADRIPDDVLLACTDTQTAIVILDSGITQHTSDLKGAA